MSLYKQFGTDKNAEANGKWVDFPKNDDGTTPRFLLRRMSRSNHQFIKALEAFAADNKITISIEALTEEIAAPAMLDIFLSAVLADWEHVQDREGNDMPFSLEAAEKLLTDLPDLYELLTEQAKALSTFRDNRVQDNAGN